MAELARLAAQLDAQLSGGVDEIEIVEQRIDFGSLGGPEHTAERTEFAELLSGTQDKKSRAYKAARRNVERWVKGRTPKTISVERIRSAKRQQSEALRRYRNHGASMHLRVLWYGGGDPSRKPEGLPPGRTLHISTRAMRSVIRAWAAGEHEQAAETLFREFLDVYEVPNPTDWLASVDVRQLDLS